MIERTLISAVAGIAAALITLIGAWLLVTAYSVIGYQIPLAAGIAVFFALWMVDWLTDELAKRQKR